MLAKIKEFLFGKDPVQSPVAAPYKVDAPAEVVKLAVDQVEAPVADAKPAVNAPAKKATGPKAEAKAPPKPRAPRKPAAK